MCLPTHDAVAFESANSKQPPSQVRHIIDDDAPHVSFRLEPEVQVVSTALSCLKSAKERHQVWYNKDDIKEFRRQAQCLSKRLRDDPQSCADENTRGVELRTSLLRQNQKQIMVKRILDAQEGDSTPEELAQISRLHSAWSKKLALAQAHKDYYAAYHPKLSSVLPDMPSYLGCSRDLANNNKRSLVLGKSLEQRGRRVRCRMF